MQKKDIQKHLMVAMFIILAIVTLDHLQAVPISSLLESKIRSDRLEDAYYNATFCPHQNCTKVLTDLILSAEEEIVCAFFDLDLKEVKDALDERSRDINVSVMIDIRNDEDMQYGFVHTKDFYALMHNKFCVIDRKVTFTGSLNPTIRGATKNNNNMLVTNSTAIADNYLSYYRFLLETIAKSRSDVNGSFKHRTRFVTQGANLKNYFCPWDSCSDNVIDELELAQNSIYFMTFSFTDDKIANTLILKHYQGLDIKGVYEKTQNSKYSTYESLKRHNISVRIDSNRYNMHHKVFIIDNRTVILGSYNPSNSGDRRNDENIIMVTNRYLASEFIEEFNRVYDKK